MIRLECLWREIFLLDLNKKNCAVPHSLFFNYFPFELVYADLNTIGDSFFLYFKIQNKVHSHILVSLGVWK